MKHLGHLAITGAITATIAAIWTPHHWQAGATALVLLIVGAAILGQREQATRAGIERHPAGKPEGPTVITNDTGQPERIVRPTYGRKADR